MHDRFSLANQWLGRGGPPPRALATRSRHRPHVGPRTGDPTTPGRTLTAPHRQPTEVPSRSSERPAAATPGRPLQAAQTAHPCAFDGLVCGMPFWWFESELLPCESDANRKGPKAQSFDTRGVWARNQTLTDGCDLAASTIRAMQARWNGCALS